MSAYLSYYLSMVTSNNFRAKNYPHFHFKGALVFKFCVLFAFALSFADLSYFLFLIFSIQSISVMLYLSSSDITCPISFLSYPFMFCFIPTCPILSFTMLSCSFLFCSLRKKGQCMKFAPEVAL